MSSNSPSLKERLAILETKIEDIIGNHLVDLSKRMSSLEKQQFKLFIGIILVLLAAIISIGWEIAKGLK